MALYSCWRDNYLNHYTIRTVVIKQIVGLVELHKNLKIIRWCSEAKYLIGALSRSWIVHGVNYLVEATIVRPPRAPPPDSRLAHGDLAKCTVNQFQSLNTAKTYFGNS